jgi:hypothetical protein
VAASLAGCEEAVPDSWFVVDLPLLQVLISTV